MGYVEHTFQIFDDEYFKQIAKVDIMAVSLISTTIGMIWLSLGAKNLKIRIQKKKC